MEFTRPYYLLLLLPGIAIVVWYFVRSLSDFPRPQRIASLIVRSILLSLVVLAISGLTWLSSSKELFVVYLVDQSASIRTEANKVAAEIIEESLRSQGNHSVGFMQFGSNTSSISREKPTLKTTEEDPIPTTDSSVHLATASMAFDKAATNLSAAIEAAAGYVPTGFVPRIVVLTDGNETLGDGLLTASRSKIPIYTVALPSSSDPEVQIASVKLPSEVRDGEPFFVEVTVQSNHDDEGMIEVFRGDHKVLGEKVKLTTGENQFRFQQSVERERLAAYSVRISGLSQDTLLDNNMDSGLVYTSGKPHILVVESDPKLIREFAYALEDEGIQVDVRPPQGMPDDLADLQNYECIVLSNVSATSLSTKQMQVARTYVQDLGGGFMMLGGEQSFGLGGYYKSALEEILPVRSDFEKEKEKPSLGMVLVIDKSGSMSGDKMEMAKSAAAAAVELLGRRDMVGVIAFDGDTYVTSEMQTASNKSKINDEISRIDAGGGTTMYPAMEMAYEMLLATQAKLKHVILLTDGVSSPGDFEGLAQQMVSSKMTVSTVAVGEDSDLTLLENIARIGKGRYYLTTDPTQVPQIFAKETVTASKSAIDEQPFIPQTIRATHALAELDMDTAPFLLGYVMTRPKPTSEVILATEKGDPLLAWWRYGLGMTAAFTSDAKARWAAEWMTWPGYGKFWTQVVRQIMRKSDSRGIQVELSHHQGLVNIEVDTVNEVGQFLNDAQVELTVVKPNLGRDKSTISQQAPGQYTSSFEARQPGAYHVEIAVKMGGNEVYRQSRGLMIGYSDELRIRPTNNQLLGEISAASNGQIVTSPETIFASGNQTAYRPLALWPWLLGAAAGLLIVDVALRRVDLSLFFRRRS